MYPSPPVVAQTRAVRHGGTGDLLKSIRDQGFTAASQILVYELHDDCIKGLLAWRLSHAQTGDYPAIKDIPCNGMLTTEEDPHANKRKLYFFDGSHRMQCVFENNKNVLARIRGWRREILTIPMVRVTTYDPACALDVMMMRSIGARSIVI